MAVGSGSVVALVASRGDLRAVSAAGVFDYQPERGRLVVLRGGWKLGSVAAGVEQDYYSDEKPKSRYLPCRKLTRRGYRTCCGKHASQIPDSRKTEGRSDRHDNRTCKMLPII
jgi:hypothetical protein